MSKPRLIAFYLPQFYPTQENDEWWGRGFTEWTNVGKAKPLFKGHCQPRVPADLGYYDLRVPEVRERQAKLAMEAGVEGFCYWHYWFAGKRLLDRVFNEVLESGKPDFPFCLCWANHSWYKKTWLESKDDILLIEQTYPGEEDYVRHFYEMLPAFKDKRYMKVDGKPIFGIYSPLSFDDFNNFKTTWNCLAKENGIEEFYFFGFMFSSQKIDVAKKMGFENFVIDNIRGIHKRVNPVISLLHKMINSLSKKSWPYRYTYSEYIDTELLLLEVSENEHPCILPNFDHSPRSGLNGKIIVGHSPEKWKYLCKEVFRRCKGRNNNIVFIKAWNEWGEGNYLEPDMAFGKQFIKATKEALEEF